jgi:hypothetical protein
MNNGYNGSNTRDRDNKRKTNGKEYDENYRMEISKVYIIR